MALKKGSLSDYFNKLMTKYSSSKQKKERLSILSTFKQIQEDASFYGNNKDVNPTTFIVYKSNRHPSKGKYEDPMSLMEYLKIKPMLKNVSLGKITPKLHAKTFVFSMPKEMVNCESAYDINYKLAKNELLIDKESLSDNYVMIVCQDKSNLFSWLIYGIKNDKRVSFNN